MECVKICPARAMTGENWEYGKHQDAIYDWRRCADEAEKRKKANLKNEYVFCGKCIGVCPYTTKHAAK